ncbi:MAG: RfaeE domain II [Parcubacteria group bacterium GW2011_GWC2_32_10]|nr:MAG: RfaeE domain II [Parcubacteria group bacterium GW2011_GWC2_32_10]
MIKKFKNPFPLVSLNFFRKNKEKLKKIVLIGGAFDILHVGHINHLKTLVVHITSDKRVREKKGPERPIFSVRQRALLVSAIKFVDYVFIYNGRHYDEKIIKIIKPNIIFFNKEAYNKEIRKTIQNIKEFEGKIMVSKDKKINSTSNIINIIKIENHDKK